MPFEISIEDNKGFDELVKFYGAFPKVLKKEIGVAVWSAAKATKKEIVRAIQTELVVTQKYLNKGVVRAKRELDPNTGFKTSAVVTVDRDKRLPLKAFSPREAKRLGGVTYRISKKNKDKGHIPHAFLVEKYGNKPMIRKVRGKGSGRGPIRTLYGPSAWGAYVLNGHPERTFQFGMARLAYEFNDRARYNKLKLAGKLKGRQA